MQNEAYVDALHAAVRTLQRAEIEVFTVLAKVAASGDTDNPYDADSMDRYFYQELSEFEQAEDQNLEVLVHVVRHLAQIRKRVVQDNLLDINLDDD
jgi:hypothetical protein